MSHEFNSGVFAKSPAWHGLGETLDDVFNSEVACEKGGIGWSVEQRPVHYRNHLGVECPIPDLRMNVRSDTQADLGPVSTSYSILQNRDAFKALDTLAMDGILKYESAGALYGGRVVWMLAHLPESIDVAGGDEVRPYVLLTNGHDGKWAARFGLTPVRVVCANTLGAALGGFSRRNSLLIRHIGDMEKKVEFACQVLGTMRDGFKSFGEVASKMARKAVKSTEFAEYVDEVFPLEADAGERTRTFVKAKRDEVRAAMEDATNCLPSMRGSAWAAWNAVTHWTDHTATVRVPVGESTVERRFESAVMPTGTLYSVKARAFDLAVDRWLGGEFGGVGRSVRKVDSMAGVL